MNTFRPANIMIPNNTDLTTWSVIACDQYTSDKEYWKNIKEICINKPSTYNLIFPEIYLKDSDAAQRTQKINDTMQEYINQKLFTTYENAYIYVERTLKNGLIRKGIVGMIDLEDYSFLKGSKTCVRATEGTVLDRLPPRVKIRQNAILELPHIMILIDDEDKTVIEPISNEKDKLKKIYDFDLMQNAGHICGRLVNDEIKNNIQMSLDNLYKNFNKKYDVNNVSPMIFATGDGNHSLATAKQCYENLKKKIGTEALESYARYALVEMVNLHDESLQFEPIHRIIFDCDSDKLFNAMKEFFPDIIFSNSPFDKKDSKNQYFDILRKKNITYVQISNPKYNLAVGSLQDFLDNFLKNNSGNLDYIHDDDALINLVKTNNAVGFLLPSMDKKDLFKTVILDGSLPRKTFSMGHADDKRFYLECRKIK